MDINARLTIQVIVNGVPFPTDNIEGWRWLNRLVEDAHATLPDTRRIETFQPKKEVADYAREALEKLNQPAALREIVPYMESLGWSGKSDTLERKIRAVHEALRRNAAEFAFLGNSVWGLRAWSDAMLQVQVAAQAEDYSEEELGDPFVQ